MPLGSFRINSLAKFRVTTVAEVIRSKKGITAVGNAQVDTAQSKFGGASALFDGSGDFLQTGVYSDYLLGTGDFTIECWFRIAGNSAQAQDGNRYASLFAITNGQLAANSVGLSLVILGNSSTTGTGIQLYKNTNTEENITATVSISQTTWHHAAVSKSGSSVRIFFNGTQVGSTTTSNTIWGSSTFFGRVGRLFDTGFIDDINGHIDELRLSNTARYTANFTPATEPFTNDANTLLLIHADGTDASTYFADDNGVRSLKGISAFGNAQIDTAQSKFSGASFLGDGNGDYLQIGTYNDLSLTGDFTIECWFRIPGAVPSILSFYNSDHLFYLTTGASSGGRFAVFQGGTNRYLGGDVAISANVWYHIAFVRIGGTITAYFNGVNTLNANPWGATISNTNPTIGVYLTHFLNGWIDEFRISNTARYTANFTPSTTPFVNDANTVLLLHMDGTDGSTVFTDDNGVRSQTGLTATGGAIISTTRSKFGGSSWNGSSASTATMLLPQTPYTFGTDDFTIECWANVELDFSSTGSNIFSMGTSINDASNYRLTVGAGTNNFGLRLGSTSYESTFIWSLNVWYHLAVVRSNGVVSLYINGVKDTSIGSSGNITFTTSLAERFLGIGRITYAGVRAFPGYIDEFRVSNTARYTANFTEPTAPFVNDANTLLLLHMDGTNGSTVFTDDNA